MNEKFEIIDYKIGFTRKSTNTYEKIRLICIFRYNGKTLSVTIFARFPSFNQEQQIKDFCSPYNAPRAPFSKSVSREEFYSLIKRIGIDNFKEEDLFGMINFEISNQ